MFPEKKLLKEDDKIVLLNKIREKKNHSDLPLILKGLTPGMSIHFAKCCNPIPGDDSVALLIEGKGLVVHSYIIIKSRFERYSWNQV